MYRSLRAPASGNERTHIRSESIYYINRAGLGIPDEAWSWGYDMKFRLGYGWLLVGGQVWLPGAIWGWWPGECLFFFFFKFPKFGAKIIKSHTIFHKWTCDAYQLYRSLRPKHFEERMEHMWNEWICNCLATARFCLTRKNDNVCGRAILSVDAIGIAFNWLKVRCWLLGGGAGLEGVERSFPQMFAEMYRPFVKLYIIFWISCTEYRTQFFFL